ncbi:MAG: hypothetical protein Q4B70_19075, partial [Lachnospiraceae bacterium]|nr:hypothetical protein [Lachnospiraceae bacterium]
AQTESVSEMRTSTEKEDPVLAELQHPMGISDGIRRLVLTKNGQELFYLSKEPEAYKMDFDYWEILNPYDEIATVNTETMYGLFDMLSQWDFSEGISVEGTDTGIESSQTTVLINYVNTADSDTALATQIPDTTVTLVIGNEDGTGNYYVAVQGFEDEVYQIPTGAVDSVFALEPFDYLLKIPALVNIETVSKVDITADGKEYQMSIAGDEYLLGKKKVEKEAFTTLYQALAGIIFESEYEDLGSKTGDEVLSVTYERNTEDAPKITITYSTYDDENYSIAVNGTERFLVNTEDVDVLIKQIKDSF